MRLRPIALIPLVLVASLPCVALDLDGLAEKLRQASGHPVKTLLTISINELRCPSCGAKDKTSDLGLLLPGGGVYVSMEKRCTTFFVPDTSAPGWHREHVCFKKILSASSVEKQTAAELRRQVRHWNFLSRREANLFYPDVGLAVTCFACPVGQDKKTGSFLGCGPRNLAPNVFENTLVRSEHKGTWNSDIFPVPINCFAACPDPEQRWVLLGLTKVREPDEIMRQFRPEQEDQSLKLVSLVNNRSLENIKLASPLVDVDIGTSGHEVLALTEDYALHHFTIEAPSNELSAAEIGRNLELMKDESFAVRHKALETLAQGGYPIIERAKDLLRSQEKGAEAREWGEALIDAVCGKTRLRRGARVQLRSDTKHDCIGCVAVGQSLWCVSFGHPTGKELSFGTLSDGKIMQVGSVASDTEIYQVAGVRCGLYVLSLAGDRLTLYLVEDPRAGSKVDK